MHLKWVVAEDFVVDVPVGVGLGEAAGVGVIIRLDETYKNIYVIVNKLNKDDKPYLEYFYVCIGRRGR